MMTIEIYIAILAASTCIVVMTIATFVAALYINARVSAMEKKVARLEGDISVLILETQGFVRRMKQLALSGNGVMEDVGKMTHTARVWCDRADRVADAFTSATGPTADFVSKNLRSGGGLFSGVIQNWLTPDNTRSFTRSIDMSESNNGSSTPRIMAAFGAGALLGVGVAILFAPQSGKKTRDQVINKTKEARDQVVNKTHDLKDRTDDVIERGKHLVNEVKNETREALEKGKECARETSGV